MIQTSSDSASGHHALVRTVLRRAGRVAFGPPGRIRRPLIFLFVISLAVMHPT